MNPTATVPEPQSREVQGLDLEVLEGLLWPIVDDYIRRKINPKIHALMLLIGGLIRDLDRDLNIPGNLNVLITERVIIPALAKWEDDTHDPILKRLVQALKPAFLP